VAKVTASEELWPQSRHPRLQSARGTKNWTDFGDSDCFFSIWDEPVEIPANQTRQEQRNSIWS